MTTVPLFTLTVVIALFQAAGPQGTATITLTGPDLNVSGEFPTTLCGSAYLKGQGMAYQVTAGDYQITIASETRSSGAVPLNQSNGRVNVVATVNGKGKNLVRGPRNTGTLTVAADYRKADATLELRPIMGKETITLTAVFACK